MFITLSCILKTRSISLGPCSISLVSCLRVQRYTIYLNFPNIFISQTTLYNVIQHYSMLYQIFCAISLEISLFFSTFAVQLNKTLNYHIMIQTQSSFGRTELAQMYFPNILPCNAWQKMRALMLDIPELSILAKQKRRTFLPSEVNIIYQHLGHP